MKEYNFQKHNLTADERIWFLELLSQNFSRIDAKSTKVKLWNQLSENFNPAKIDYCFVRDNRLTLLGVWLIDSKNELITLTQIVFEEIKRNIKADPYLNSIDATKLSSLTNISEHTVKIILTFLFDFRFCNGGSSKSGEIIFDTISFNSESHAFDKILSFRNIEETLEDFYNENVPNKDNGKMVPSIVYRDEKRIDINKLGKLIARLNGLREVVSKTANVRKEVGDDYNLILRQCEKVTNEDLSEFSLSDKFWHFSDGAEYCESNKINNKLLQVIPYLEEEIEGNNFSEIDILFNSIIDEELRSRCSDILSAQSHFDRVINQSTQVLENRIRKKAKAERSLVSTQLINRVLNSDISRSKLILSKNSEEHEGIVHICRGIMLAFRNPSHHHLTEKYTQSEALKFCSFIDNILQIIDNAELNEL